MNSLLELIVGLLAVATVASVILRSAAPARALASAVFIAAAGWCSENAIIRLYAAYAYSHEWRVFIDRVPLAIVLAWPALVLSATVVGNRLSRRAVWQVVLASMVVVLDAAVIEPISVAAGYWQWNLPGTFGVPSIAIVGWALFALLTIGSLKAIEKMRLPAACGVAIVAVSPLLLLALLPLLATLIPERLAWPYWLGVGGVMPMCGLVLWAMSCGRRSRLRPFDLLQRTPAAAFFFLAIAQGTRDQALLVLQVAAIATPHLFLCVYASARKRSRGTPFASLALPAEATVV